jgi:hypothetical protein
VRLDLRSRVVLASKVSFFFRLWKLWLCGDHRVLGNSRPAVAQESFVSQQCFVDIQMSCYFVVLLICLFRDKYPSLLVPLYLTGSDACEIFFSKIGGMVGMERAYDFHELIRCANTLNQLAAVEYGTNGLQFGHQHNKQSNIWSKLHPREAREILPDLGDYSLLATDALEVDALKEGLKETQKLLRSLNMAPSSVARNKKWFTEPWTVEKLDPKHFAYVPTKSPVPGEDGDCEVLRHALELEEFADAADEASRAVTKENEDVDDLLDAATVAEIEARDVICTMLDNHESQVQDIASPEKVIPFVEYDGNVIYKSTLVSQLNGNPFLSKDRLIRVRNFVYFNNSKEYMKAANASNTCFLGLGSDCVVYMLQRSSTRKSQVSKAVGKRGRPRK